MRFVHGSWQRPSWHGRFVGVPPAPHPGADDLIVACLLLERQASDRRAQDAEPSDAAKLAGNCSRMCWSSSRALSIVQTWGCKPMYSQCRSLAASANCNHLPCSKCIGANTPMDVVS